ncbi:MAG: hypothetical protein A4E42_01019 [Methanoregulaceae archaeon PtaU1.Bin222]|nr:MAG: hypothetical protein A4E42_01019 [Methanoregulaceae archaeon PtaU1.Bin222]
MSKNVYKPDEPDRPRQGEQAVILSETFLIDMTVRQYAGILKEREKNHMIPFETYAYTMKIADAIFYKKSHDFLSTQMHAQ